MSINAIIVLTVLSAIIATMLLYLFVFPEKKKAKLNGFFKKVRRLLSSEYLLIEKILRFLYVLATMACVFGGFWALFWVEKSGYNAADVRGRYYDETWLGYYGILIMVLGPIVVRILYESFMMFIMLVKNTIDIRNHLIDGDKGRALRRKAPKPFLTNKPTFETGEPEDEPEKDENPEKEEKEDKDDFFM